MSDNWCSRCGGFLYRSGECRCRVVGKVWQPDHGQTEQEAKPLWSRGAADDAIEAWAERSARNDCEMFQSYNGRMNDVTVAFRPADGGEIEIYTISCEYEPVYRVTEADGDEADRIADMLDKAEAAP
jgi:hypothetical protein